MTNLLTNIQYNSSNSDLILNFNPKEGHFLEILFKATSVFGTVGLSMGLTP